MLRTPPFAASLLAMARLLALGAVLALAPAGGAAQAQELQKIAAVVNDDAVTYYDLLARIEIVIATSNLPRTQETMNDLAPQVLQALITEKLQLQEAAKRDIEVTENDLAFSIGALERNNNMPAGSFMTFLSERGLDAANALHQIRAQIAWSKLIRARYATSAAVSPSEVELELARRKAEEDQPAYRIAEIFLPADDSETQAQARADAENLVAQLRQGASFPVLARQFSQSASAAQGGDLGWLRPGQLTREVAAAVAEMKPGEIAGPLAGTDGYRLIALIDRTAPDGSTVAEERIRLAQILFPLDSGADDETVERERLRALNIAETVTGCAALVDLADRLQAPSSGDLGELKTTDLPEELRAAVAGLAIEQASPPVRTAGGWHVLMVCERLDAASGRIVDANEVRDQLTQKKLDQFARQYLRDLRRQAFIDTRL